MILLGLGVRLGGFWDRSCIRLQIQSSLLIFAMKNFFWGRCCIFCFESTVIHDYCVAYGRQLLLGLIVVRSRSLPRPLLTEIMGLLSGSGWYELEGALERAQSDGRIRYRTMLNIIEVMDFAGSRMYTCGRNLGLAMTFGNRFGDRDVAG